MKTKRELKSDLAAFRRRAKSCLNQADADVAAIRIAETELALATLAKVEEAKIELKIQARERRRAENAAFRAEVDQHNESNPKRKYTDDEIRRVLESNLGVKAGRDHLALAVELGMNFGSVMWYLKMHACLNFENDKTQCSRTVIRIFADGDQEDFEMLYTRNKEITARMKAERDGRKTEAAV